jgi:hypothetical protein
MQAHLPHPVLRSRSLPSEPPPRSPWLWCLLCERTYPRIGTGDLQPCPYADCKAHAASFYAWDWNRTRRLHPEYPGAPAPGTRYPLLES